MLTTAELIEATEALSSTEDAKMKDNAECTTLRAEHDQKISALELEWMEWLTSTYGGYLGNLPDGINAELLLQAWGKGHADGYEAVEIAYQEIAEQSLRVAQATRSYFKQR